MTMLSEKHIGWVLGKNPDVHLKHSNMTFRPYSTDREIPLLGMCDMRLWNENGKTIPMRVYIAEGEEESLLGRQDAINLGILRINLDGDEPEDNVNKLRCITPELLKDVKTTGVVSGGKTQKEIDQMKLIADKHHLVFEGMGRADVDSNHIQMKDDMTPISQGNAPSRCSSRSQ